MNKIKAAIVQICSGLTISENLNEIEHQLHTIKHKNVDIIVLPESFAMMGRAQIEMSQKAAEVMAWMSQIAQSFNSWLVGGALPTNDHSDRRNYSSCFVYNPAGVQVTCYNKIHLFDVTVADNILQYKESDDFIPGSEPKVVDIGPAKIGLSICYDLRFPELYRYLTLKGATILTVPSAFTQVTGAAHWEVLLKARAIENQCYVLAPNQSGTHPDGRQTYGHSMIISPWGKILAQTDTSGAAVILSELDMDELKVMRQNMPCLDNRRM